MGHGFADFFEKNYSLLYLSVLALFCRDSSGRISSVLFTYTYCKELALQCAQISLPFSLSLLHCMPAYSSPLCAHTALSLSLLHYSTELALQCAKELSAS